MRSKVVGTICLTPGLVAGEVRDNGNLIGRRACACARATRAGSDCWNFYSDPVYRGDVATKFSRLMLEQTGSASENFVTDRRRRQPPPLSANCSLTFAFGPLNGIRFGDKGWKGPSGNIGAAKRNNYDIMRN
ncbi:Hypothetical protein NTJ_07131 [Nesidiocoris tenuis]|uniref:Uncharacterized protein n=1 Tax=Nesidiocoris tenuis TaxID=355587 RepID=A0ABN7ASL0_9HEMI|nr:Hypothetical protein NTJ_07131 [Nesidiocoris tenuis]